MSSSTSVENDLGAIKALNQHDIDAVLASDTAAIISQWGTYRGRMRPRAGGETVSYSGKLMRILQRQPDGS